MSAKWWTEHRVAFSLYSVTSRGQSVLWSHVSSRFDDLPTPPSPPTSKYPSPTNQVLSFCTFLLPSRTSHTGGCATNVEKFSVVPPCSVQTLTYNLSSAVFFWAEEKKTTKLERHDRTARRPSIPAQCHPSAAPTSVSNQNFFTWLQLSYYCCGYQDTKYKSKRQNVYKSSFVACIVSLTTWLHFSLCCDLI